MPALPGSRVERALHRFAMRAHRSPAVSRARGEALELIEREALIAPAFAFGIRPLAQARDLIRHPAGVSAVAACACTLGDALEARVRQLFASGRRLVALELDALGSELLHRLSRTARAMVRREAAAAGLRAGDELAPGHEGLALDRQPTVLALAGAAQHGIAVSGSHMLLPFKSLTFVVPLGRNLGRRRGGLCARCASRERCRARAR